MNNSALINKYRPETFSEVIGNTSIVKSLQDAISSPAHPHSFLLTGPSGIGKTTLARIVANHFNAWVDELDAASNSGIDAMRMLVESTGYTSVSSKAARAIIIDECHALSKPAWQPLLKLTEEPPKDLYMFFCTTELNKVPETIRTRCFHLPLKPVSMNELSTLLETICLVEGWAVQNDVFQGIILAATGQPRKAISFLQAGHGAFNLQELSQIVAQVESDSSPLTALCKFLLQGGKDWKKISAWLAELEAEEDAHTAISRYMANAMIGSKEEAGARTAWVLLDALLFPSSGFDKKAQLANAIGKILFAGR